MISIIKKEYSGESIQADPAAAILFLDFIKDKQLRTYQRVLPPFVAREKTRVVYRQVGAAYEHFQAVRISNQNNIPAEVQELSDLLQEKIFTLGEPEESYGFCAAAFHFPPLGGMTSHRDYSFNRQLLGSLVVTGKIVFGVGQERDQAYENSTVLHPGNLMVLNAPLSKDIRPYFSVFCPEESIIVRTWIRPAEKCSFIGS